MQSLELYFDFSSTNAYFAAFLAPEMCRRIGADLIWKPYHLGTVFRARDHSVLRDHGDEKLDYLWRDHQRWSKKTGLAFNFPSTFPIKTSLALRGSLVLRAVGKETDYIQAVMRAYWVDDLNIADAVVLEKIALGMGAEDFLSQANSSAIREQLKETTAEGVARGAFGAPMLYVGDEMFWGKDRMDFVEEALLAS